MKISKYIPKLAFDNVRKKKNRTLLSFISIMLSSAIIFVSLTLFSTVFTLSKSLDDPKLGTSHYYVTSTPFENISPLQFSVSYFSLPNENNIAYFEQDENSTFFILKEGRLPQNSHEIIAWDKEIGDKVANYEVVGVYEDTAILDQTNMRPYLSIDESLKTEVFHYFIADSKVHESQSLTSVSNLVGTNHSLIFQNEQRISNDTILNYLQDTTTILIMFVMIIVIAIFMCLVSIYNVLIVNDQDRRKEIGLLKSIGITKAELIAMILLELTMIGFVAGGVGIVLGMGISYLVLNSVLESLKVVFQLKMLLNPFFIILSLLAGILLMDVSGFVLYRKYFDSKPISDLKGEVVDYDIPYNPDRFSITSVTWRMFVIYNERIKRQTKNLLRSFFLVMFTITLFCGIFVSNFLYQQKYREVPNDFLIETYNLSLGSKKTYPELETLLYEIEDKTDVEFSRRYVARNIFGLRCYMPSDTFTSEFYKANKNVDKFPIENTEFASGYHEIMLLDDTQLNDLKPYIIKGDLDNLNENSVILITYSHGTYTDPMQLRDVELGSKVILQNIDNSKPYPHQYYSCDVVVQLPFEKMHLEYSNVTENVFTIAFTNESFATLGGPSTTLKYQIHMTLENPSLHHECLNYLVSALNETGNERLLVLTDYIQIRNDGQFAVFLIEILLYPLLLMLVLIGVINVNNVLKGNIHMKRTDFSTMKSVGMTSSQLSMIMTYEYAETYINAGVFVFLLCIPVAIFENFVKVASTFKIADNFAGMFIMSFVIISPIIIISLAIISFKHLRNITALDGMKDVE